MEKLTEFQKLEANLLCHHKFSEVQRVIERNDPGEMKMLALALYGALAYIAIENPKAVTEGFSTAAEKMIAIHAEVFNGN